MVVAAGAGDRQSEERARRDIDLFIDDVIKHFDLVLFRNELRTEGQEAGRHQAADIHFTRFVRRQQISGYLLAHEPVVGNIPVEGIDNVIAITPGIRVTVIFIGARGIRIAGHIHPMSSPTLPVTRRIDQPVHYPRERLRRSVFQKVTDFGLGGRQSGEIESGAAQKRHFVGRRRRL